MNMTLDIDLVLYMKIIGTLMVLVAVVGYFVCSASLREHFRERERQKVNATRRWYWDTDRPEGLGQH